jgi:acetyl-CoA acetyltransferase
LSPSDVDGLAVGSFSLAPDRAIDVAWKLGLRLRFLMEDNHGGAAGITMIDHARRAVEAGDASVILVVAGDLLGRAEFSRLIEDFNTTTREYLTPLAYGGPNALFAMVTTRQMQSYGLGREDYGAIAVAQRAWAAGNPSAVYRTPLTLDDYLDAPLVADPLCRFDCAPLVAGADAVVVTTGNRARRPVTCLACRAFHNVDQQDGDGLQTGIAQVAGELWNAAGFGPDEADVISVYDDYPAMVLAQLADLGYAPDGDLARLARQQIGTGSLAVNTSGGQLSAGQAGVAGGLHGVVEIVRQLRGEAHGRQIAGARNGVATGYGMIPYRYGACANALVLGRSR